MANELAVIDTDLALSEDADLRIQKIEHVLDQLNHAEQVSQIRYSVVVAKARRILKQLLDDSVLVAMRDLISSVDKTGIRRDNHGLTLEVIKDDDRLRSLLIAAFVEGLFPVGNEINILAGNVYATKEAYERKLHEAGIEYQMHIGADEDVGRDDCRAFPAEVTYRYRGREGKLEWFKTDRGDFRIRTTYNKTDKVDTLRGKAESKVLRQLYKHCTGRLVLDEPDGMEIEGEVITPSQPEPTTPAIEQQPEPPQGPTPVEEFQDLIAECDSLDACKQLAPVIKKSKRLSDEDREGLLELLRTKHKRIEGKK